MQNVLQPKGLVWWKLPCGAVVGRVRPAHWGKRESLSFAKKDILLYSFCSRLFIDRQLCLRLGQQLWGCRPLKTAQMSGARFNSRTDWWVRWRLRKTVTQNLLLKSGHNFRRAFLCMGLCEIFFLFFKSCCSLREKAVCLIFGGCFYPDKVGHFGDKFLCRHQLLASIDRCITLRDVLNDFCF